MDDLDGNSARYVERPGPAACRRTPTRLAARVPVLPVVPVILVCASTEIIGACEDSIGSSISGSGGRQPRCASCDALQPATLLSSSCSRGEKRFLGDFHVQSSWKGVAAAGDWKGRHLQRCGGLRLLDDRRGMAGALCSGRPASSGANT